MDMWKKQREEWLEKLESGDLTGLRVVYSAFATDEAGLIRRAGAAMAGALEGLSRPQLLRLCEWFRELTSLEWTIRWAEVSLERIRSELPEETYRYVLILGSFHPNGYFREKCLKQMAEYDRMLFWIFFRVNDWVVDIRDVACEILEVYLQNVDAGELFDAIPAFERLQSCHRRSEHQMYRLWEQIRERMLSALEDLDIGEIPAMEPVVRKSLYRVMLQAGCLTLSEMDALLGREKQPYLKKILLRGILEQPDCTTAWAERYLTDSSAVVRKLAVKYKYEHLKTCWQGLEEMLLDSSRGVREAASYILKRHSRLDIRTYYLGHLGDDRPAYAIMGLAESSTRGNVSELIKCLKRPEKKICKHVLLALGEQEDFSDEELLWHYLLDDREDISKAAYLSICKRNFSPGVEKIYQAYREAVKEHHKRYLTYLLLRESSWRRLPCLIRIYRRDMPENMGYKVLAGIRFRFMYVKVPQPLCEDILLALKENGEELPEGLEEEILYDMKYVAS